MAQTPSDSNQEKVKIKLIGEGTEKWPMLESLWDFFSEKGIKTIFVSIGIGENPHTDLEIAETLGCPLHIYDVRENILTNWETVQSILKNRKPSDQTSPFLENIEKKWVLPKNIRIHKEIPTFFSGQINLEGTLYSSKDVLTCVKECCSSNSLRDDQIRVDILKICLGNKYELPVLQSFLTVGFRPGMILIEWSHLPDEDSASCITAGHLQTCGYRLLASYGNRFLYIATDRCMYDICSWQDNNTDNPMVTEIVKSCKENVSSE